MVCNLLGKFNINAEKTDGVYDMLLEVVEKLG